MSGDLTYVGLDTLARETLADMMDLETRRLSSGPGLDAEDLEGLLDILLGPPGRVVRHAVMMDGLAVGRIDFNHSKPFVSVGFMVHRDFRGRGIMSRAWRDLQPIHGDLFSAACWSHNLAARRTLASLGFRERGFVMQHEFPVVLHSLDASSASIPRTA